MGEIGRRLVHAAGVGFPLLYLLDLVSWNQLRVLLVIGAMIAIALEALRLEVGLDWWIYEHLTRPYEANSFAGYGLYMLSITAVALVFVPPVAIPGMLMLMLGDPVSGYLGSGELRRLKRPRAMLGMFIVSFGVTLPFALSVLGGMGTAIVAAAFGAALGTIADAVKPTIGDFVVDDNLTIPPAAAIGLWVAYTVLPAVF